MIPAALIAAFVEAKEPPCFCVRVLSSAHKHCTGLFIWSQQYESSRPSFVSRTHALFFRKADHGQDGGTWVIGKQVHKGSFCLAAASKSASPESIQRGATWIDHVGAKVTVKLVCTACVTPRPTSGAFRYDLQIEALTLDFALLASPNSDASTNMETNCWTNSQI